MMGMSLTFMLMRIHAIKTKALDYRISLNVFKKGTIYSAICGPLLYIIGGLASCVHTYISSVIFFSIAVYFIFPHATKDVEIGKEQKLQGFSKNEIHPYPLFHFSKRKKSNL